MSENIQPEWVGELKAHYLARSSSFFILHGNVDDLVGSSRGDDFDARPLSDFLAGDLLRTFDLILHYDVGRGLRPYAGGDPERHGAMNRLFTRLAGPVQKLPRDPKSVLRTIDELITLLLVGTQEHLSKKTAFVFDYADLICPPGDRQVETLAMFLNWARSPVVKRVNMIFILLTGGLSSVHPALIQNAHTTEIRIPLPDLDMRRAFIGHHFPNLENRARTLSRLSAGLTLNNLDSLLRLVQRFEAGADKVKPDDNPPAYAGGTQHGREIGPGETSTPEIFNMVSLSGLLDSDDAPVSKSSPESEVDPAGNKYLSQVKKELIESQCPGLIEFIEPKMDLTYVAGHQAAKKRLEDDADLIKQGRLEAVPMGYLICGPVGVGKTFIAMCYAGTVGIPCVTLRNFRSKYVGETEANLERILGVLRELGPVAVIIDEADAAVGNRGASGDSGTSSRVFAQLASQMGDTQYRGRIIWFLLTCRPDLLPVDLKRQGRCEEHIPLFYPETREDFTDMFLAMSRKLGVRLEKNDIPDYADVGALSGADIESLLTRTRREAILLDKPVDKEMVKEALSRFRSLRGPEHELQWLASILECSDLNYLPPKVRDLVEREGGYDAIGRRFRDLSLRISG